MANGTELDVAIVGAGPYGLSVAAHVAAGNRVRVFGSPLRTWDHLPPDMTLRSEWEHTNLSAPRRTGTLDHWATETHNDRVDPIPIRTFLRYGSWFIDRFVPEIDPVNIESISRRRDRFHVQTADDRSFAARSVVVATGITPFARLPEVFHCLGPDQLSRPLDVLTAAELQGARVAVIGGGQNAMESALRAKLLGAAQVDVIVRANVRWFAEHEPSQPRGRLRQMAYRAAYPIIGFGPPPINRVVLHPELFAKMPVASRERLNRRLLRSGGSPRLREQLQDGIRFRERTETRHAESTAEGVALTLSDGERLEVDRVIVACGFRFDLDRLKLLDDEVKARIKTDSRTGWPVISNHLATTMPGLHVAGYPAEGKFGPIVRFIEGTRFVAERCAAAITS